MKHERNMDMKEIQQKNDGDIVKYVHEQRAELHKLRFGTTGSMLRDTRAIRRVRKDIARALTEINVRAQKGVTETA